MTELERLSIWCQNRPCEAAQEIELLMRQVEEWNGKHQEACLEIERLTRERDAAPELAPLQAGGLVLHGLRATAIVRLRRAGATTGQIKDMVGLSEAMVRCCPGESAIMSWRETDLPNARIAQLEDEVTRLTRERDEAREQLALVTGNKWSEFELALASNEAREMWMQLHGVKSLDDLLCERDEARAALREIADLRYLGKTASQIARAALEKAHD